MSKNYLDYEKNNPNLNQANQGFFQDRNLKNNIGFLCIVLSILGLLKSYEVIVDISNKKNAGIQNTITGKGTFEIKLNPNIGNFHFVVKTIDKTSKESHQKMIQKSNQIMLALYDKGVEKDDLKAEAYVSTPKYSSESCRENNCPVNKQSPIAFESSQVIFVKLRDIKKSGEIISFLNENNIDEIGSINYEIDDIDKFKEQARREAIELAKKDAKNIAKSLGVRLNKLVKFTEYAIPFEDKIKKFGVIDNREDFNIPVNIIKTENGEQKIQSNVIVTYQIN